MNAQHYVTLCAATDSHTANSPFGPFNVPLENCGNEMNLQRDGRYRFGCPRCWPCVPLPEHCEFRAWKPTSKTLPRSGETVERGKQAPFALFELCRVIDRSDSRLRAHVVGIAARREHPFDARNEGRPTTRRSAMESPLTARPPLPRRPRRSTALCASAYRQRSGSSIISLVIRPAARSQPGFRRQQHRRCRTGNRGVPFVMGRLQSRAVTAETY